MILNNPMMRMGNPVLTYFEQVAFNLNTRREEGDGLEGNDDQFKNSTMALKNSFLLISLVLLFTGCEQSTHSNGSEPKNNAQVSNDSAHFETNTVKNEKAETLSVEGEEVKGDTLDTIPASQPNYPKVQLEPKPTGVPTPADKKPGDPSTREGAVNLLKQDSGVDPSENDDQNKSSEKKTVGPETKSPSGIETPIPK